MRESQPTTQRPETISLAEHLVCENLLNEIELFGTTHRNDNVIEKEKLRKIRNSILDNRELVNRAIHTKNGFGIAMRILDSIKNNVPDSYSQGAMCDIIERNINKIDREMTGLERPGTLGGYHAVYADLIGELAVSRRKQKKDITKIVNILKSHAHFIKEGVRSSSTRHRYISSLSQLVEMGGQEEEQLLKDILGEISTRGALFPKHIAEAIRVMLSAYHPKTGKAILIALRSYLGGKNSYLKMLRTWESAGPRLEKTIQKNFQALLTLEQEEPGTIATLYNIFGVCNFGRYPKEMLLAQIRDMEDKSRPYGILLYPLGDENGAFFGMQKSLEKRSKVHKENLISASSKHGRNLMLQDSL